MIETYKIIHGLYDTAVAPSLMMSQVSHTKGNTYTLQKNVFKCDIRKYFFTERVVNLWNSLPSLVVDALSLSCFKELQTSYPRPFIPKNESSLWRTFVPQERKFLELSFPGPFVPGTFRPRDLSFPYLCALLYISS